jgi:mono/diheme cytochrome c family protein
LLAAALGVFLALRPDPRPASLSIAGDPFLQLGQEVYLDRCVGCHGPEGRGDGPTAVILKGRSPGNFTARRWRHGEGPEQVRLLIDRGVLDAQMPAFGSILTDERRRAVAAYVYFLGNRPIPDSLRVAPSSDTAP